MGIGHEWLEPHNLVYIGGADDYRLQIRLIIIRIQMIYDDGRGRSNYMYVKL